MIQTIKNISIVLLFFCFIEATENNEFTSLDNSQLIDLSVYDGQGALLLSWSISDTIKISETRIYSKEFGQKEFELLSILGEDKTKYLDSNCEPGSRYFYKIAITDMFGKTYSSDLATPPFGTCIPIQTFPLIEKDVRSVHHLIIEHLHQELISFYPYTDLAAILSLLNPNLQSNNKWIEVFPLEKLLEIEPVIQIVDDVIKNKTLYDDIMVYGPLYKNHLYLEPQDWKTNVKESISNIRNEWKTLYASYVDAKDLYDIIAPVRIIGSKRTDAGNLLKIYLFHPEQMHGNDIYVMSGDEYISINNRENSNPKLMLLHVPIHWDYVDLMMNDVFIQSCPLFIDDPVIYTIEGDIMPMDDLSENSIRVENEKSSLLFNELTWNPFTRKLNLELAGSQDLSKEYFIKNDNSRLWEIGTYTEFQTHYYDSTFILDQGTELPTIITLNTLGDNENILEYIVLDTLPFAINRIPDGGSWHYSDSQTLGMSNESIDNDFDQEFVPDLFVLYQNYPNPFNGQTKISFDLLEDAIVNLYITDATGRIHDKLIEEEYKNRGMYNYVWNGDGRSTGIYFITLFAKVNNAPPAVFSRKMIYLK